MEIPILLALLTLVYLITKLPNILARVAHAQYMRGDVQKAVHTFARANKLGKMNPNNKIVYGYLLLRLGEVDKAAKVLNLVSLNAKKPAVKYRARAMFALVEWKRGDIDEAIDILEVLIEKYKTTNMYQNLGLLYVLKGEPKRALAFNLEAYDYSASDKIIVSNLAESYVLNGDFENAKETYEKLMTMDPHFPEAFYGYGKLLVNLGEKERGIELIRQSLDKPFTFLSVRPREDVELELERIEGDEK
ncbi:MAG: tetratricopeptide repeat protein [Oscillospiraceae bacterium]|nr:tetratricopeptide repeat protein [Oscillospiraceae bacterium]